jgi:hypothetical protein
MIQEKSEVLVSFLARAGKTGCWTRFSVTVLSWNFGVTVPERMGLGGYVECSHVPVDLEGVGVAEARHSDVWPMLFFRLKEHTVSQAQH